MISGKTREMLAIAFPAILEGIGGVLITTIDTKMISPLGGGAISAVSLTAQPKLIFFSVFFALGTSASMYISQSFGKKDKDEANAYLRNILRVAIIISLLLGILLFFLARPIMTVCNRQPDTLDRSIDFFRIIMLFSVFQAVLIVINSALRGIGLTKYTLISNIVMGVVDVVFNYLLIEGHMGFPRLEVKGDAIATVTGTAAASLVSALILMKKSNFLSLKGFFTKSMRSEKDILLNIRNKAGNIIAENILTRIGFLLSSIIISTINSSETAVYYVGMILLNYSFAFGDGIQAAVVALTGRSMGAKAYAELKEYARIGLITGIICSLILCAIYISTSGFFFDLYFDQSQQITDGFYTSCIAGVLTILQITRIVRIATLRGLGEVKDPRKLATIFVFTLNPLLSLFFLYVLPLGIWGIWLASVITQGLWCLSSEILCRKHLKALDKAVL